MEVRATSPSKVQSTEGRMNRLTRALITAPRASIPHRDLMISMREMAATPMLAQKNTNALVMIDPSAALAAAWMACSRGRPPRSSSWKRVVIRMA